MHCLLCSLCNLEFSLKEEWNDHLLTLSHQQLAQEECQSCWFEKESVRDTCLLVFSSCPLSIEFAREIISLFGSKFMKRCVTDFVWRGRNSTVAVIQFESRSVAEKVLKENPSGDVILSGKLIQIRCLSSIRSLQWKHLIPSSRCADLQHPTPTPHFGLKQVEDFRWIRNSTLVNTENWAGFCAILAHMKKMFSCPGPFVFRNYNQRIQYFGAPIPLIFICQLKKNKFVPVSESFAGNLVRMVHSHGKLNKFVVRELKKNSRVRVPGRCFSLSGSATDQQFGFGLVTDFKYVREVQLPRLLEYLCEFDSRLNGVLVQMAFWSRCHHVSLAGSRQSPEDPGNPVILQWLVVLFLMKQGIIPSGNYIRDNVKSTLLFADTSENSCPAFGTGFTDAEMGFVHAWTNCKPRPPVEESPEWVQSVVALTQEMFEFYSTKFVTGDWILNTYNGTIQIKEEEGHTECGGRHDRIVMTHPLDTTSAGTIPISVQNWETTALHKMSQAAEGLRKYLEVGGAGLHLWEVPRGGTGQEKILGWQKSWQKFAEFR